MKIRPGGYSLIEALIVIAISSTIFLGVAVLFGGSRQNVDFNQAKIELETKLKGYVNHVSTGTFAGNNTHRCSQHPTTFRPILTAQAGITSGSSEKCIYLGKALQTIDGSNKIYVYDVLGLRNKHDGAVDSQKPAANYEEARPEPAGEVTAGPGTFNFLFVEEYEIPSGLRIVYSQVSGTAANILKIYSSLDGGSARGVKVYSNEYQASSGEERSMRLRNCIRESTGVCQVQRALEADGWDLCVENTDGTKRSKLNVKPTSTGIVTTMTDGVC